MGSGPGRGCRWPWSWDSILTQGTGLFIFPFLKKSYPHPFKTPLGWKKPWAPTLPAYPGRLPSAHWPFSPPSNVSSGQFDHWWSKE